MTPAHTHVRVLQAKRTLIDQDWDHPNVRDWYWRLYINQSEGATLTLDDASHRHNLSPNKLHLVPAWVQFSCTSRRSVDHLYVHFELNGPTPADIKAVFTKPLSIGMDAASRTLVACLQAPLGEASPTPHTIARAGALVQLALAGAMETLDDGQRERCFGQHIDEQLAPALRLIETQLGRAIPNAELAETCHLSEDHFIRRFRETVGQPPARYIAEQRVARAAQRLLSTDDSIDEIAQTLGFADRFYFSRVFSKVMGVPPATYRKRPRV